MEVVIAGILGGCLGIVALVVGNVVAKKHSGNQTHVNAVYLLHFDGSGKIEIKNVPEQLWNWKF